MQTKAEGRNYIIKTNDETYTVDKVYTDFILNALYKDVQNFNSFINKIEKEHPGVFKLLNDYIHTFRENKHQLPYILNHLNDLKTNLSFNDEIDYETK